MNAMDLSDNGDEAEMVSNLAPVLRDDEKDVGRNRRRKVSRRTMLWSGGRAEDSGRRQPHAIHSCARTTEYLDPDVIPHTNTHNKHAHAGVGV